MAFDYFFNTITFQVHGKGGVHCRCDFLTQQGVFPHKNAMEKGKLIISSGSRVSRYAYSYTG